MARKRAELRDPFDVVLQTKRPGVTRRELLDEARQKRGFERTNKREGWTLAAEVRGTTRVVLVARLLAGRSVIAVLDHHLRPSTDEFGTRIPAGYHWDVHLPDGRKAKVFLDPQPTALDPALDVVLMMWNVVLDEDAQREMT
jgi:hypothetical protein